MSTEELKVNPEEAETHEAQLAAERMASGEEKTQTIDVDADYEASKEYSVSEIDKTGAGAAAAEAVTSAARKMPQPEDMRDSPDTTGNPADYLEMAREVNPRVDG